MQLEPIIGLEIHVQLTTKSKMFCSCANIFGPAFDGAQAKPNSAICPICLGYPGTLPVPNATAIAWAQKAGAALGCELAKESKFDRKSYFYPDLPKGYQISQYDKPFCGKGSLTIVVEGKERTIGITRVHLEEDAAKNIHPSTPRLAQSRPEGLEGATSSGQAPYTLVDYNRAGTPLIEIVTEPDFRSPAEAKVFLQELQNMMRTLRISDADMEKGQLRCDANISLRQKGSPELSPKTEIKNLNSFRFVERALQYEIERQTKEWAKGDIPTQSTRGYNSTTGKTFTQRTKEEAADYRYFPEPDIPLFIFSEGDIKRIQSELPELPLAKRQRLIKQTNITEEQARLLVENPVLSEFFEETVSELQELDKERTDISPEEIPALVQSATNMTLRDIRELLNSQPELKITAENFAELVILVQKGKMNKSAVPQVLHEMQRTGGDPDAILQNLGLEQVSGEAELEQVVQKVINENPDVVAKIKAGKGSSLQYLMGQVMAKTKGKANPKVIIELLRKAIS